MGTDDVAALRRAFEDDGVVHVPALLDTDALALAVAAFDWSLANPGPAASRPFASVDGAFYQDLCNAAAPTSEPYRRVLHETPVARLVADLFGDDRVWFMYEQVFLKEGGETRRTPWHQDLSYLSVDGSQLAVMWLTFDEVPAADSLEFVRGSHRGTLYNTSAFVAGDETAPIFEGLPRLPDVEADRSAFDIVSWAVRPGDAVVFHPAMLHGGAPTHPGTRRRTLTLRFFGPDAVYATRPGLGVAPRVAGLHELKPGDPFRSPAFPDLAAVAGRR